jgi:putative nucleotidyltransferase with HDIG domain
MDSVSWDKSMKAEKEVNHIIKEEGEHATFEVGIHNLHPELVKLLGRLKYRTSYGQNVLKHSVEVSHLAGLMAGELGLDIKVAKRAGLLHDIGKAVDHEIEGTHVDIGIDLLRKYKESEAVINGMAAHHGDYEPKNMEAILISAADALSAARPGARRETLETYIKRLQKLEDIANTTTGVERSYAIQAGREIRIIAKPEEMNDEEIQDFFMVKTIAIKIGSNKKQYLDMLLSDRTGELTAKKWDIADTELPSLNLIKSGDIIKLKGVITEWNGMRQFRVLKLRKAVPEDKTDITDYIKAAPEKAEDMYLYILEKVDSMEDQELKRLCSDKPFPFGYSFRKNQVF